MQESPLILERRLAIAVQFGKIAFQFRTTVFYSVKNIIVFNMSIVLFEIFRFFRPHV